MKGLYHYNGMKLHFLSEDEKYAVYQIPYSKCKTMEERYNPFRVYEIKRVYSFESGWRLKHTLIEKYADLYSCVCRVRREQGYDTP